MYKKENNNISLSLLLPWATETISYKKQLGKWYKIALFLLRVKGHGLLTLIFIFHILKTVVNSIVLLACFMYKKRDLLKKREHHPQRYKYAQLEMT